MITSFATFFFKMDKQTDRQIRMGTFKQGHKLYGDKPRQLDRQTDRQTDRQIGRQTDRQTDPHTHTQTHIHAMTDRKL